MTDAPRISDAEADAMFAVLADRSEETGYEIVRQALSAFLSARCPVPLTEHSQRGFMRGHNACIDLVLKGKG